MMRRTILSFAFLLVFMSLFSQGNYRDFHNQGTKINKTGMAVLGSWAVVNLATGAVGWSKTTGSEKYFHQMNFFWNTVNLGIAGFSAFTLSQMNPWMLSNQEIMTKHIRFENLYLINAGLDVAYIGTGFLLRHLSENSTHRKDMLKGYGSSAILQGAFLLLFDGVMYSIQHIRQLNFIGDLDFKMMSEGGAAISYSLMF